MKATEIIKLMEMLKAFPPQEKPVRRNNRVPRYLNKMDDHDVIALMHKRIEEAQALEAFLKEREKINKKEEKKEEKEKKGWSIEQIAIFLVLTFPVTGLLYVKFLNSILAH
jgi:hypothetical protein